MHGAKLRDTDFEITVNGNLLPLADYFSDHADTTRLGIVAPNRFEGVGATNLIMAHVTAFYDCYRAVSEDFFAYPDYFSFQTIEPLARYGMFDISPAHKNVLIGDNYRAQLSAITDRAINILLVPEGPSADLHRSSRPHAPPGGWSAREYDELQLAAAERLIDACYAYSASGSVQDPDVVIRCKNEPLAEWAEAVINSVDDDQSQAAAAEWKAAHSNSETLEQTYRRISLQEALMLI